MCVFTYTPISLFTSCPASATLFSVGSNPQRYIGFTTKVQKERVWGLVGYRPEGLGQWEDLDARGCRDAGGFNCDYGKLNSRFCLSLPGTQAGARASASGPSIYKYMKKSRNPDENSHTCVYMYIYICVLIRAYIHTYRCIYAYTYCIDTHLHIHVCMYACMVPE